MSIRNLDRVVYILEPLGPRLSCFVRVTKLMKWESFSEMDFSDLSRLFQSRFESYIRPIDRSIVMGLMQSTRRKDDTPYLEGEHGYEIFRKMVETGRAFFSKGGRIRLKWDESRLASLSWEALSDGEWRPRMKLSSSGYVFATNPPIYIDGQKNACGLLDLEQPPGLGERWLLASKMNEEAVSSFCLRLAQAYPDSQFSVPPFVRLDEVDAIKPKAVLMVCRKTITEKSEEEAPWQDLNERLRLRLRFRYGRKLIDWDEANPKVSYREDGAIKRANRDRDWERSIVDRVEAWGFVCESSALGDGFFNFDVSYYTLRESSSWSELLQDEFPRLDPDEWEVQRDKDLRLDFAASSDCYTEVSENGQDWFSFNMGIRYQGKRIPLLSIVHRFLRENRERSTEELLKRVASSSYALRASSVGVGGKEEMTLLVVPGDKLVRVIEHLFELFDRSPFDEKQGARLNRWRVAELASVGVLDGGVDPANSKIAALCQRLAEGISIVPRAAPTSLNASLRPYQEQGLGWLRSLEELNAGGILADEMGLGKTVQALAHILESKEAGTIDDGVLIVAPTSVIHNWEREAERFAPSLRVVKIHGSNRDERWKEAEGADIALTSYPLLWRDSEQACSRRWSLAILDEAQFIKNPNSRTAKAARSLQADRRLCLTGTPVENRLEDLWSQFEFLMPGYLGDEATFKRRIALPMQEKADSPSANLVRERLRKRLAPFMLRRTKQAVLPELPPKTEIIHSVSMTQRQSELYESVRLAMSEEINREMKLKGIARSKITILAALLKLRQICCDPRLSKSAENVTLADSAKLIALLELLEQLQREGRKALVFSQFTSMLDLIGSALKARGLDYLLLTGKTRDRASVMEAFQGGEASLFLISLKAGGTGLNLTAADSVIHYDPWWNPAVERQATDRAHRIGQEKPVFVYKLIVEDSIESKILELQRSKMGLADSLFSETASDRLQLDQDTLNYLFEG